MIREIIRFEDVSKGYTLYHQHGGLKAFILHPLRTLQTLKKSRYVALNGISFSIGRGETIGIIGRNGAGKSTLLGLIAGIMKPTSGRVHVAGRVSPLLELGAGFHHELTGRENILMNGVLLGLTRREVNARMEEIIAFSELAEFIDQPIKTYSSGMLARLGFSVVVHLDPEVLLIDEVLAVGDIEFQKKCLERIENFRRSEVTIVFVSHSMADVERICDRAIWIEDHRVKAVGEAKTVVAQYRKALGV
ncbi:MAG: hypothetical protein OHK006_16600 [Thermodesulfovibrionales bacterium]